MASVVAPVNKGFSGSMPTSLNSAGQTPSGRKKGVGSVKSKKSFMIAGAIALGIVIVIIIAVVAWHFTKPGTI